MVLSLLDALPISAQSVALQVRSMILLHPSVVVFSSSWTLTSLSQLSTAVSVAATGILSQASVKSSGRSLNSGAVVSSMENVAVVSNDSHPFDAVKVTAILLEFSQV